MSNIAAVSRIQSGFS